MIIAAPGEFREAARGKLPRFLFDYIDGGANQEITLKRNVEDLAAVTLRQRVLNNVANVQLGTQLFGQSFDLPIVLAPVGLLGMCARRGEVQAGRAARTKNIPMCLSTVSICSIAEVRSAANPPLWFQLYILKDRGFMKELLARAREEGCTALVFTVDMPLPGMRFRDAHSGMSGPHAISRRYLQAMGKPAWAWDVGVQGRPHQLGNLVPVLGRDSGLADYMGWIGANFDPSIQWSDLEWVREQWSGPFIIKGILDVADAKAAVSCGADGIVVSNHGGRQLDGVSSTARALPAIAQAVGNDLTVLADSGVRSGLDVVRMLALGARGVLLGRIYAYALATGGYAGLMHLLDLMEREIRVAMALTGSVKVSELNHTILS